ncbi:AfsR/SARP family transcriptional regulator [Labedaea rhizosphaerae]|uniref:DNA-binding SARP family transcriptional activator n=1 Tax=Labedaea rhizosphaerae TaxID=598644 RepID=A0A4R6S5P7_LABRH|nr:tetratricopeptide repeat protein [Labedaea rhizosphaerae]TDP94981.1 DNA-binding SARP family transcriptional activator [Labedaea rhizosphaerae]
MEFRMLGPLEAWHDGAPVPLGDQQQRFILVVLLLHANRPVSTARLTEIVWGDNPARSTLVRSYIKRLRDAFQHTEDVQIETTPTGYLLRVDEERLDTVRFDRLRTEAASAAEPAQAIELLRAAVSLWRGRFLEDIDIDRVGGAEVISPDEAYPDAVGDLAELELDAGHHRPARDRLRPVVAADPASTRHAELLIRALLAGGDRVGAVRVFNTTRDALAAFGMEPGPVLRNLVARAEHGEPPSSLGSRPGGFTGREDELATIEDAALTGLHAVWVSGPPGIGKTGLAIEAAYRLRERFLDGQILVRLNGFTPQVQALTAGEALAELLRELGVPAEQIPPTVGRKVTLLRTTLSGTRTLIVLDNASGPDQIRQLLPDAPGCMAIVTSRRAGGPDTGPPIRLAPLPPEEAADLFGTLAGPHRVRGKNADVAAIVKRCGFLPMPIRVAATLLRRHDRWPLEHLVKLLDESGPWDDEGAAAVRVSYQQLGEQQQTLFRFLGGLPGPDIHVAGAAALSDSTVPSARLLLDELHEVSLVEETVADRYRMLDPLKAFAAAEPRAGYADAMLRLLDHTLVTLAAAFDIAFPFDRAQRPAVHRTSPVIVRFTSAKEGMRWLDAERDNLVAAVRYAATHDLPEHTWQLAVLLWRYFNTHNQLDDWVGTLNLAWRTVPADDELGQAHVLLRLATAHDRRGQLAEALDHASRAVPLWQRLANPDCEAAALCAMAMPLMELGRLDESIEHFTAALASYEQTGDRRGHGHALSMLGYLNEQRGNYRAALEQHASAARMLRSVGHTHGLAHTLDNLGSVQQRLGLFKEALASHLESHALAVELGDQCGAAYALNSIGAVHRLQGKLAEAVRYQAEAARVAASVPDDTDLHTQLALDQAATARAQGNFAGALRCGKQALELAGGSGNLAHQALAHRDLAESLHAKGSHGDAVAHWVAAETGFASLELPQAEEVRTQRSGLTCACGV